ncbi:MAG: hypothetical protein WDN04_05285 [Rhodospirillales bacterium]
MSTMALPTRALADTPIPASFVSLYGIIDTSVEFLDNAAKSGGSTQNLTRMTTGGLSGSRWGITERKIWVAATVHSSNWKTVSTAQAGRTRSAIENSAGSLTSVWRAIPWASSIWAGRMAWSRTCSTYSAVGQ